MDAPGRKNIDWDESMSVIVQALHAAGYEDTAKSLGSDKPSTIQPFQPATFRRQFLGGFWESCTETLLTIHGLTENQKCDAIKDVLQMWLNILFKFEPPITILTTHKQAITCMKFSNNGRYLASGSGSTVIIWEVPAGWELRIRHILEDHIWPISCVSWSCYDDFILTCSPPEHIKMWDVLTGECLHLISEGVQVLRSCFFLISDQNQIVYGTSLPPVSIQLWGDSNNPGAQLKSFQLTEGRLTVEFTVTPDGKKLIYMDTAGGNRLTVKHINDVKKDEIISEKAEISGFIVSSDSENLIVNMRNDEIHVWDLSRLKCRPLTYWGFNHVKSGTVSSCFGGVKKRFLATGTDDSKVCIWNRRYARPIVILGGGHTSAVRRVDWNPGRPQMLASAGDDNTICIWGPRSHIFS